MSKTSVKAAVIALVRSTNIFVDISNGEKKDWQNQTPVAEVISGATATKPAALGGKTNDMNAITIRVLIAYSDQGTAEASRDLICDTLLRLFHTHRGLGGGIPDVIEQIPREWVPSYVQIGATSYLCGELRLRVWEQYQVDLQP